MQIIKYCNCTQHVNTAIIPYHLHIIQVDFGPACVVMTLRSREDNDVTTSGDQTDPGSVNQADMSRSRARGHSEQGT